MNIINDFLLLRGLVERGIALPCNFHCRMSLVMHTKHSLNVLSFTVVVLLWSLHRISMLANLKNNDIQCPAQWEMLTKLALAKCEFESKSSSLYASLGNFSFPSAANHFCGTTSINRAINFVWSYVHSARFF